MKKIYLVITPYFPSKNDFRGSYILDQVTALKELSNYDIKIIKLCREDGEYVYNGFKIKMLKTKHLPSSILPGFLNKLNYSKLKLILKEYCDLNHIDIVHAHSIYPAGNLAYLLKKEFGFTTFIQYHGLSVFQTNLGRLLRGSIKKYHDKFIIKKYLNIANNVDLNIGVSNKVIEELNKFKKFIGKTYTLYNGIDTSKFFKINSVESNSKFTIGCIGNFWYVKDQITLLKAIKEISSISLKVIFIGTGPDLDLCKAYVKENKLQDIVEFRTEVAHEKLNYFYNTIDLFILPSFYEALGCVYLEALQVGTPIIGVKNQGIPELLKKEDKEFFLIKKSDYIQLSELIAYHYKNKNLKEYSYDFNIKNYINDFLTMIKAIKNV